MQDEISLHNVGWKPGNIDLRDYLFKSELRYWIIYKFVYSNLDIDSLDVGVSSVHSLMFKRLGYNVAMTEALKYYSDAFLPLFSYLTHEGVEIIDCDPFDVDSCLQRSFDVVTSMAVIEHYPHSLRHYFDFMNSIVSSSGILYIDVPNIAYWPKRWSLLTGRTPLSPAQDIFNSLVPYTGHHHEYTMDELKALSSLSGFKILNSGSFNYSFVGPLIKRIVSDPILTFMSLFPSMRECLSVVLIRSSSSL